MYDLFWLLGVLHTDGYIYRREGKIKELRLRVGLCSFEMLIKWKTILDSLTGKQHKILQENHYDKRYNKTRISLCVRESSKTAIESIIRELPDLSCVCEKELGAYLAGIIDGDGCIQIRKRYSDKGYERLIKIVDKDSNKLIRLQNMLINEKLPKGYITNYKGHSDLWIYINKEFNNWLIINVVPHISIRKKLKKLRPVKCLETDAYCPDS